MNYVENFQFAKGPCSHCYENYSITNKKDIIVKSIVSSLLHKIYNNRMYKKND